MATSDVTFQDGDFKHPYLLALVRWCVSSFWTTATVILHRLLTAPLPPNTGSKTPKPRPASSDHLHPEPRVECEVLHTPPNPTIDVIFVHGLYGSLANTWRQGEWMSKYGKGPTKVPLRRPHSISTCKCTVESEKCGENDEISDKNDKNANIERENDTERENDDARDKLTTEESEIQVTNIYKDIQKILPNNDIFITDKFYNNTLLDQEVSDHQKNEQTNGNNDVKVLPKDNLFIAEKFYAESLMNHENYETQAQFVQDLFKSDMKENQHNYEVNPTDSKENLTDSEVNLTDSEVNPTDSEVYPTDKVSCKCTDCVGCGCVCDECYSPCWPRDWVRVDYPGARVISINYTSDPYLWRPLWVKEIKRLRLHDRAEQMMSQLLDLGVGERPIIWVGHSKGGLFIKHMYCEAYEAHLKIQRTNVKNEQNIIESKNDNIINHCIDNQTEKTCDINDNNDVNEINGNNDNDIVNSVIVNDSDSNDISSDDNDVAEMNEQLQKRAALWTKSSGFMFYSVPHRGSPLADIKTPITARSIELMEICKDCPLVLSLQERWSRAAAAGAPAARSLVESCRTLMSVLYLRIVSVHSADPGIGALHGVSVDHREICKPSSRQCLLYQELMTLMRDALKKYNI
ncbi:unnamed protein product, partial [Brenthis ino]